MSICFRSGSARRRCATSSTSGSPQKASSSSTRARSDGPTVGSSSCGKSGSGKSSTTLSTLGSDLLYAGDDYVAVSLDPETGPYVHSLYGCGKLETGHVARFPRLEIVPRPERDGALPARRDKTIFYVRDTYPELRPNFSIASIWAGAQNALAGGGSFITLPSPMLTGMDARAANITSTVALFRLTGDGVTGRSAARSPAVLRGPSSSSA